MKFQSETIKEDAAALDRIAQHKCDKATSVTPAVSPQRIIGLDVLADEIWNRLRLLRKAIYGTKRELCQRLVAAEAKAELQRASASGWRLVRPSCEVDNYLWKHLCSRFLRNHPRLSKRNIFSLN